MKRACLLALVVVAGVGCGEDDPANVAGNYTIAVTNGVNGCNFPDWTPGQTTPNIPVTVTQDGDAATATVSGLSGVFVEARLGSRTFNGKVGSSSMRLELFGTRSTTQGQCAFTVNGLLRADIDGDILQGSITYTTATNHAPDCGALENCESVQAFNGTRPPTAP